MNENPDFDIVEATRKLSVNLLNTIEMSSQEAAWFILRLSMSKSSVEVAYIPTCWPHERERIRKTAKELEQLPNDSIDFWRHNWFDEYEKRPPELAEVTLAEFVANYTFTSKNNTTKITVRKTQE